MLIWLTGMDKVKMHVLLLIGRILSTGFPCSQACGVTFKSVRLLPMGSHPRVADKRATYDLFGPVSKLWSANYDRAMVGFMGALKEFGEHARQQDEQAGACRWSTTLH